MRHNKKLRNTFFRRITSFIIAFVMVLGVMPLESIVAFAEEEVKINYIIVNKTYENPSELGTYFITLVGENLDNAYVQILKSGGELEIPQKSPKSTPFVAQYTYNASEVGERLFIDGIDYSLGEEVIPKINDILDENGEKASDNILELGEDVILGGDKIPNLKDDSLGIDAYFAQGSSKIGIVNGDIEGNGQDAKIKKNLGTSLGSYNLVFKQEKKEHDTDITIEHTYKSIVSIRGELNINGNVSMFPTQGPVDTLVTVTADTIEANVSIFLMKKGEEYKYTKKNMVSNDTISHSKDNNKEKISFRIPQGMANDKYNIVFTNKVNPDEDIDSQISKYKVLGNYDGGSVVPLEFTVVDGNSSVDLRGIGPKFSSIKGTNATIHGLNMVRISTNLYEGGTLDSSNLNDDEVKELVLTYKGGQYDGKKVDTITRKITVQIGSNATITNYQSIEGDVYDYIDIIVPENDDLEKPKKDVIIIIEDKIEFEDGTSAEPVERDSILDGFTYKEFDYEPEITNITPDIIPVDSSNKVTEDIVISIMGQNFLKYGYLENGKLKIKTPEISINNQAGSNQWFDNENIRIYDETGTILEDKLEEQLGSIIKINIKAGSEIPEALIGAVASLRLQNPLAVESEGDKGSDDIWDIRFVEVASDKTPIITGVDPNIVTTEGNELITIKGSNFGEEVSVYLEGDKIENIDRNGTGTEITFTAPARPEGIYQIIVQNEEGGLDTFDRFVYVKTYTDIRITDFEPKKGTANTLVTVTGENFVRPNPVVKDLSGMGIYRLIGTRVFLGDKDVNSYKEIDGVPILEQYTTPTDELILSVEGKSVKASDYYHSIILEGGVNPDIDYYSIYFDTVSGNYRLTNGDREEYVLGVNSEDKLVAKKDGSEYEIEINDTNLVIKGTSGDDTTLTIKTPYETTTIEGEEIITGNRVKVKDGNELIFTVPPMEREGYYDLTVENPDTKRDAKKGNLGFYYSFQPDYNPVITEIKPNEGSTEGEYYINIEGNGFKDNGNNDKTSVIIGSVKVASENVEVSTDGNNLRVKVPPYPGNLEEETDMDRKSVAVVVTNPDGGSASIEDGFTYVIPISHPKITKLILSEGSAAGGETVIIEGSQFRYFEPYKDANNNTKWDEGEDFTDKNDNDEWDDLRHWRSTEIKEKYDELLEEEDGWDKYIKPVLPKIYFGGEVVTIKEFTSSTIEVETPKGIEGTVEVYLVNNDHGISNKIDYTYEASNPNIEAITPDVGKKQGDEKVEILGGSFSDSTVNVIDSADKIIEKTLPIVQFGNMDDTNISNRDIPIDAPQNSGRIRDRQSTVQVGNLNVHYDATSDDKKLNFTIEEGTGENKVTYELNDVKYYDNEVFLPVSLLKESDTGEEYDGYEYVRIMLERVAGATSTNRLRVDRGFSPDASLENSRHIILKTPSYYTIGKVPVTVINPDNGKASIEFEYKNPDSEPTIRNIFKDGEEGVLQGNKRVIRVNYNGGNTITILGSDFRKPVKSIAIGNAVEITEGIEYAPLGESVANRITFKMPAVAEEYLNTEYRLIVENEDGGVVGSDSADPPIYIEFTQGESDGLAITEVSPNFGPSTGGTNVTIKGNDFRRTMDGYPNEEIKIYFGDGENQVKVNNNDIISVDFDKIVLKTPAYVPGTVSIKVENPDGNIVELQDAFTYLSDPKITAVVDPLDENERNPISIISVLGDTEIKLKGSGFMEGATVYFVPKLKEAEEDEIDGGDVIYIKGKAYVLEEGNEGTEYNFIDNETITIKTPEGKLDEYGLILVNPDGGATEIYEDITYGLPELNAPTGVVAELVYDRFIRVHWNEVEGAEEYEIFVVVDDENTEFIGSTELTSFAYNDLEPRTRYRFVVKAVGDFGSSNPSMESNTVKTGRRVGPPDEDGSLTEDTVISKTGDIANVIIGKKEDDDVVIDLTRGDLAGSKKVVISMPASVVTDYRSEDIKVIGSDFTLSFNPSAFNVATVRQNEDREDAGVRFEIEPYNGNNNAPGGNVLSNIYNLEAYAYVGKNNTDIKYLAEKLNFVLDYDMEKANMRKLSNIEFNIFDDYNNSWQEVDGYISLGYGVVSGKIDVLGRYTAIGTRR